MVIALPAIAASTVGCSEQIYLLIHDSVMCMTGSHNYHVTLLYVTV